MARSYGSGMAGWASLADPPRRRGGRRGGRFLALAGASLAALFMAALLAYLLATDPAPGLAGRSLLALTLAAAAVVVLGVRAERAGALALFRTMAEYGIVALLVLLLVPAAAPPPVDVGRDQPAAIERQDQAQARPRADQASQLPPGIRHVVGIWSWLADRWREADERIDRQTRERLDREQQRSRAATTVTTLRRPAYRFRPAGGPPPPDHPDQGGNRP
jgi:hypothetical protein